MDLNSLEDRSYALILAAQQNLTELVNELLTTERDSINVNASDEYGWTALSYACYYGHSEVTRLLLLAGADPNSSDSDLMTPLIWAAGRGHSECVNHLLRLGCAKIDQADKNGTTPLIWACRRRIDNKHASVEDVQLSTDISLHSKPDNSANCLLVEALLKAGANINATGMLGITPLLAAVSQNNAKLVQLLLHHKPNVNTCDNRRYTPLSLASKKGNMEIVKLLLKAKAIVNLGADNGNSSLINAAKADHQEAASQFSRVMSSLKNFLLFFGSQ